MMDREMQKRVMAGVMSIGNPNVLRQLVIELIQVDYTSTQEEFRLWEVIHAQQAELVTLRKRVEVLTRQADEKEPT